MWDALRILFPFASIVVMSILFGVTTQTYFSANNLLNILRQLSILFLVAQGGTFVIIMGSIDLSVGSIVSMASVLSALFVPQLGLWVVPVSVLIGAIIGLVNGTIYVLLKIPSFLATLGMASVLQGIVYMVTNGAPVPFTNNGFTAISDGEVLHLPNIALWALITYVLSILIAFRTRYGRYMYALGGGEKVARLSGVPVKPVKILTFVLSGLLCALAGVLASARLGAGTPDVGTSLVLDSIAAIVMGGTALTGGVGGPHRTILGVLVITILDNGMVLWGVDPFLQIAVKGVVVIVSVALTLDHSKIEIMK
jgi:ribose transport system permease protein/putative xylitol transport system permease protein